MTQNPLALLPRRLLPWFQENARDLPWRQDRHPYHVWLSEIMLQQTRVEAVRGYYLRFLEALPTIESLAQASESQLLKLWEGLGYYNRARNLQKTAQQITGPLQGQFPSTYPDLLALPGIGEYTAGAIGSICFGLPVAAVDGNVLRVVSRFLADPAPITDPIVKKSVKTQLEEIYPAGQAGDFTQSLMELGATVCLPNGPPRCSQCPLSDQCAGYRQGNPAAFPKKAVKPLRKRQERTVFLLRCVNRLALEKRPNTGLLAGLWQLPNVEGNLSPQQALEQAAAWNVQPHNLERRQHKKHIFTHIQWEMEGYFIACGREDSRFIWVSPEVLRRDYSLPTAFRQFLEE